jgi:hypothetical protein
LAPSYFCGVVGAAVPAKDQADRGSTCEQLVCTPNSSRV